MLLTAMLLATAQPQAGNANRAAERALFEQIVELQTVEGRPEEFRKLTTLLNAEFRKAGMTTIIKDHDNTQTLIARWKSSRLSGRKPILLLAHMDVVEAKASDWKNPPFEFREQDGYYLGRGAADNKAALTGFVLALQYLKASGWQPTRDIIVLFTGDEETTGNGARRAASEWRSLIDAPSTLRAATAPPPQLAAAPTQSRRGRPQVVGDLCVDSEPSGASGALRGRQVMRGQLRRHADGRQVMRGLRAGR